MNEPSTNQMLDDLRRLVEVESPSRDMESLTRSAETLAALLDERIGSTTTLVEGPGGPHVQWSGGGAPRVLILGHHDTVFPLGTLAARPFTVDDGRATGPGVFDMKGGIVQAMHALASLQAGGHSIDGVEILLTADEEVGSGTSRTLLEERARACGAVLVLEPSADGGALKTGRKGTGMFVVTVHGRAAHAGLEPEKGVNALVEAAHQVLTIAAIGRPDAGTTVTPTIAAAGTADNVVPAEATIHVDVRVTDAGERQRVLDTMHGLTPIDDAASLDVSGGIDRPPMPESASSTLFPIAEKVAARLGIGPIGGLAVGGGSDGNFTAAAGVPTLDGLGAVGGGAHADHEYVEVDTMVDRARLLAGIVAELLA